VSGAKRMTLMKMKQLLTLASTVVVLFGCATAASA
jgi:hypothetical protein